jgi:hypothetical protein
MARKFFYIAAGMLMLALSYHFGASTASAQAPGNPVVAAFAGPYVVTANGDVYAGGGGTGSNYASWALVANVFSGGPTPALHESWGQMSPATTPRRA